MKDIMFTCRNGGCTKPTYRGRVCFRCWAGIKWTSIRQRVENKNGNNRSYEGVPLGFTREQLIQWVMDNPPPAEMDVPSIDRIRPELGYVPGNIRWLERNKNSAGHRADVPDGLRVCSRCNKTMPLNEQHFGRTTKRWSGGFAHYCRECNRAYKKAWRESRENTL
jgi:hypothetical protein